MSEWQPIETAPKDGREVYVKRVREGRLVAEGLAVFGHLAAAAPSRRPMGVDPLGRLSAADYAREDADRTAWAESAKWLKPDRLYAFPTPTHWLPDA